MRALPLLLLSASALAGPQHWGFGFGYLVALEREADGLRLAVYEPPLRPKDGPWLLRFTDRSSALEGALALAAGDFWPAPIGKDRVAVLAAKGDGVVLRLLEPPEVFGTRPWRALVETSPFEGVRPPVLAAAGDVLGQKRDQLLVVSGASVRVYEPPAAPDAPGWRLVLEGALPEAPGAIAWADGRLVASFGARLRRFAPSRAASSDPERLVLTAEDGDETLAEPPAALAACDFLKEGQARVVIAARQRTFEARARGLAPMRGEGTGAVVALAAGRVFGVIRCELTTERRKQQKPRSGPDAEIAFVHRLPLVDLTAAGDRFGWPKQGETVTYEVHVKNNGDRPLPRGQARLRAWLGGARNADVDPATRDRPDRVIGVPEELPPFDPRRPRYAVFKVTLPWPYGLRARPEWQWKALDLDAAGERWLVVALDAAGDVNERNDRYEAALAAYTLHPVFKDRNTLADRTPTVDGDPWSKEYLTRKLADAVTCMWERSATARGEDVRVRVFFDGYRVGWPLTKEDQRFYEGWRELDGWWGENQNWERFDPGDGGGELHETGHLFHQLGDLYQYHAFPAYTALAQMADGRPVQLRTHCWGPDSFATGHTKVSEAACELHKFVEGARGRGIEAWHLLAPRRILVRVLDRDGKPVPDAEVALWLYRATKPLAQGKTGTDGRWDIGHPFVEQAWKDEPFGRPHYESPFAHALAHIFTVRAGPVTDAAIWGTESTWAHSRYLLMGRSFTDPDEWTWDFPTLYRPGAPEPRFQVRPVVDGRRVALLVDGARGPVQVWTRSDPDYVRRGPTGAPGARIDLDLSRPGTGGEQKLRALVDLVETTEAGESNPRSLAVHALLGAQGITHWKDDRFLVAWNGGQAQPFGSVFRDESPEQELLHHWRFGHTARKLAPSALVPGRLYATLERSDTDPPVFFELIEPRGDPPYGLEPVARIHGGVHAGPGAPRLRLEEATARGFGPLPGDLVTGPEGRARITTVTGGELALAAAVAGADRKEFNFEVHRLAGAPGKGTATRELQRPRGLASFVHRGREHVAIADHGNGRVVVWDADTRFVAAWGRAGFQPAAVAAHPEREGELFVLDRRKARGSQLHLLRFDGRSLEPASGWPRPVDAGDREDLAEMGLAVVAGGEGLLVAITDAEQKRVLEYQLGRALTGPAVLAGAIGPVVGPPELEAPVDVAWRPDPQGPRLYAIDRRERVVRLK
jgi:hypothetical protein